MIRASDFNPKIKYSSAPIGLQEDPEWKRTLHFLNQAGSVFYNISRGAKLAGKVSHLSPVAAPIGELMQGLGRTSQIANFYLSMEAFSILVREGKLGLNALSLKETLLFMDKGIDLVTWFTSVRNLGATFRVLNKLSSVSLGIALLSPMLDLLMHLRTQGWKALSGPECYKTSYKLGLSLLAIYLFVTALTLSTYLNLFIQGVGFALQQI